MKAIVFSKYGSTDVLELKEVEKPIPKDNEVLVRIRVASVNAADWEILIGTSFLTRLITGLTKPKHKILGADIAGLVEAVGRNVKQFQPGDEIFGDIFGRWGGFAEYVCARENTLALKPTSMTFEEAAAVPTAAVLALHGLRDSQNQPGQKILINGAGGGFGTFAVQIAKSFGAEVTGVDSAKKLDMVRSLGADHVIDYEQEDFTQNGQRYDLILDVVGDRSMFDCSRALSTKGTYVMVGGSTASIFQAVFLGLWISMTGSKKVGIIMGKQNLKRDLAFMTELIETGKVVPVIDRSYSLDEVPEALRYVGEGHAQGKVVITLHS